MVKLIKRVKKLEQIVKTNQARKRAKIMVFDSKEDEEDPSKQGRSLIEEIDLDAEISLNLTLASPQRHANTTTDDLTLTETLMKIKKSAAKAKVTDVDWDDVQAQIQADEDLALRMQEEEKESLSIAERARLLAELINKRKKLQAAQRYEAIRTKPKTKSQQRKTMCTYMKNMAGYKMKHFKGKSFYEIKEMFDKVYKQVTSFIPMDSVMGKEGTKRAGLNLQEESLKRQKTREGSQPTVEEPKTDELS
ncbi:hypothetical protein Tco_0875702 [Tanacetum coccineum]|uniref:Uncharacterized protein n=1 Tax=Tanacetum coccineum TaxID=301880 RepID=A0ABQ5BT28_9ASTR